MSRPVSASMQYMLTLTFVLVGVGLSQAQSNRPATPGPEALTRQVRIALGHGSVDDARTIVSSGAATPAVREFGTALIEIFQGADDSARKRLEPLAAANREASLELALLELRHGQRDSAMRRLQVLTTQGSLRTADDYYILARAARAMGGKDNKGLANEAHKKTMKTGRPEIDAERGDLYLEDHQNGYAVSDYREALQADGKWVTAHLGISRAFANEDPEVAEEAFNTAREIAPDHPEVLLLAAERALNAEDVPAAVAALDRSAKVRPGWVKEAAMRAAIAYAERKPADVDAAIARVREINPLSDLGYRSAGQQAARKYRFLDAAEYARKAVALDGEDAGAWAELGLYLLRTGDETEARTALESSFARDTSDPITKNLLDMLDSLEQFEVIPDGEFIFKFPKDQAAVLKPYALPLAQEAYKTFAVRYGFKPTGPILVEVFGKHDDFAVRTVGLMGLTGALGACFGRVVTMDSPKARPPGDFSWQATLWHEIAHVFSLQLSEFRVPRWLTEGISVYEEFRKVPAWGRELDLEYARALASGKNFGVKGLPAGFKKPQSLSMAYHEASLVVEHLVALHGEAGLRTLLKAYADGATDTEAFAKAFAQNVDDVDKSFAAFVKERYGKLSQAMGDPPSQVERGDMDGLKARAERAPGSFMSQLTYGLALVQAGDFAAARPVLERASALAPQAQGSMSPRLALATIAEKDNDIPRARKELRELLNYDHTNIEAARKLASLAEKSSATEDQDLALRLVADLDPFDGTVHSRLGKREVAKGRHAQAVIEFQAALALNPANLAEAHTDLGESLLATGKRDEARKEALLALQLAPTYPRAQDLLLSSGRR